MKNNFRSALSHVLTHEGGWADHPKDPGGATMKGVTLMTFRRHYGKARTKADLRNITDDQLEQIYRDGYWNRCRCDALPDGVDYAVFDAAVNSGPRRSIRWLKSAVCDGGNGGMTDETVSRVLANSAESVVATACGARLSFLQKLRTWSIFGKGWSRRVEGVQSVALAMIFTPYSDYEVVSIGSTGEWVKKVQLSLGVKVDGSFGRGTESALIAWQVDQWLQPDGVAGRKTYQAMGLIG